MIRRVAIVAIAMIVACAGLVSPAHAAPDVYTTPGGQVANGRLWTTGCARYSSSVVRCTTNIYGTLVVLEKGKFTTRTGWHFNNLTYLPSARSSWLGNPLASYGRQGGAVSWTSAGLEWRTECDTSATGRGACRSYIHTQYAAVENGKPVVKTGWVFNNLVRFAEGSVKSQTAIPAHILDQSVLTFDGLGPIRIGERTSNLTLLGYTKPDPEIPECWVQDTKVTSDRGVMVMGHATVEFVQVEKPGIKAAGGAEVGMTLGDLKRLYGSNLRHANDRMALGGDFVAAAWIRSGAREIIFGFGWELDRAPRDNDVIEIMSAAPVEDEEFMLLGGDGC